MSNKKRFLILFLLLIIITTTSTVSANDLNQSAQTAGELIDSNANISLAQDPALEDVEETPKTFFDLNYDINANDNSEIYLDHNYTFNPDFDLAFQEGINIERAVTIWGNGHTLNGNNSARIFNVNSENVVFYDLVFINGNVAGHGGAINGASSAVNCSFKSNAAYYGGATSEVDCINCSFIENTASYRGGASSAGSFENCIFTGNFAYYDGGAYFLGSNIKKYSIVNCTFSENSANEGGAIHLMFSEYCSIVDCIFTWNSATWTAGAIYDGVCENCTFIGNTADYGGVMRYGWVINCILVGNSAIFGGANYEGGCRNSTFIENYAEYGGAVYDGFRAENCMFIGNHADYGGAIHFNHLTVETCYFANNTALQGGATYDTEVKNCYFENNTASQNGGGMYGGVATDSIFKDNLANVSGNDAFNTKITNSNCSNEDKVIYFDASAEEDGNGSEAHPYKYLYADRLSNGVTAYFNEGTYELNSTCPITGAKLTGRGKAIISSRISNQYDFIITQNSYLEIYNMHLNNINILNQGTLKAKDSYFEGNDVFDPQNRPEIESGSGLFDSSYGGVIVCDAPDNVKTALMINGCYFELTYDAFNGGAIAAVNSNISISNTVFMRYSATYKGGAIYCENSNLNLFNVGFTPFTSSTADDTTINRYRAYTAYYGGSIYCENSNVLIERSRFNDSISFSFGGDIASLNSHITIKESDFNNSISLTNGGGAIYNSKSELHIFDSKFTGNSAEFGGAICNINSILDSYHATYRNNYAKHYGGSIYDIYGTMNIYTNWFYVSHAEIGGAIYTRIPNEFNLNKNTFGDCFADEGSSIFYDGKRRDIKYNYYGNDYHVFAEFRAKLNGEDYYIISNPIYYKVTSNEISLYRPFSISEVSDGLVTILINNTYLGSNPGDGLNNISLTLNFNDKFVNPTVNVYLFEDLNFILDHRSFEGNLYADSRNKLFEDYNLVEKYTIDLSDSDFDITEIFTLNFGKGFLTEKHDNLYEATSFNPVSLINYSFYDATPLPSQVEVLASHYSSNDYGYVSSVKDQGDGGNCWAFSGIATLETCLSKATGVTYDFSEENAKNLMAAYSVYGMKLETNYAGYESMILSYLTSWLGPIDDSEEDYDDYSSISILHSPMFHIQNVKFLPARADSSDNYMYKLAIRDNGAVSVTFKWGEDYHSVSLVGWDDNYVGYDSLGNEANGAWIFKNSWGPDWENNGFGYLSYDEKISEQIYPNLHAYTFVFSDNNPYTKIYQYDFAGVSEFYHYMDSISFMNKFTADTDSILSAFSTYFDRETNFTVSVYKNGEFVFSQDGTSSAGYYTIPFNTIVQLDEGDEFAIAINNHNKGYNCIPVCSAEEITKKTFNQNLSFISVDGENWFDLYDYADSCHVACIKAFTQNINLAEIKINIDEFDTVNTKNFNIKVDFDDVDVDFINNCLVKFIIDCDVYYAQIRNGAASLNVNLEEGKHTLFAQYKDNLFESNVVQFNFTVKIKQANQSYNALQDIIDAAEDGSAVTLDRDYFYDRKFDDSEYGVHINRILTINGNEHIINGLGDAAGFYISANNVILNDIIFNNTLSTNGGGVYITGRNITLNNCSFINSRATQNGGGVYSLFDITLNGCRFINDTANVGGGIYLISSKTSNIENSLFDSNFAEIHGSAIHMEGLGKVFISTTDFTDNVATFNGGAVMSSVYQNIFEDCSFSGNMANSGGAVFSNAYLNDFANCSFRDNHAKNSGGAINAHNAINIHDSDFINNSVLENDHLNFGGMFGGYGGGAIYSYDLLNIYNSNFINNSVATDSGGALYTSKYLNVYNSKFINNTSPSAGGAVFNTDWQMIRSNMGVTKFTESHYYDSVFISNHANDGGAIYKSSIVENCTFANNSAANIGGAINDAKIVKNSIFTNNSASFAGAIYNDGASPFYLYDSEFIKNHAENSGGAIYSDKIEAYYLQFASNTIIYNSIFEDNSAVNFAGALYTMGEVSVYSSGFSNNSATNGGAIYSTDNMNIHNSSMTNNSANYGGAILLDADEEYKAYANITSSNFTGNKVESSGGALYLNANAEQYIENSNFINNAATFGGAIIAFDNITISSSTFKLNNASSYGGAIDFYRNGAYSILNSEFENNTASYGGAIYIYAPDEESMAYLNVSSSSFTENNAIKSGGAFYADAFTLIENSSLTNNTAKWGSAIYGGSYLTVDGSNITTGQNIPLIEYSYHYSDENPVYGKINLKNNNIDAKGDIIHYNVNGLPSDLMVYLVFTNTTSVKGKNVTVCHLKDKDGDPIPPNGIGYLKMILTDQNNDRTEVVLKYDNDVEGYVLDTSSLDYGTYTLSGTLTKNYLNNTAVKGILKITDEYGRTAPAIASGLTKVYGKSDKLVVTLKDPSGNPIAYALLTVKLNGKTTTLITDKNGRDSMKVTLAPNTYYASISFENNGYYTSTSTKVKVIVKKATPKIVASKKTFKKKTKIKKYTVTLKNNLGKAMKKVKVTINVKGKKYTVKTNSKGKAIFKLKLNKKGKYKATITYKGNKYYNKVTKKVKITVK
ncbi:lectin like domain-containing protein [Methanobrevibacter sp.]